jgi:hypothetical protein
VPVLVLGPLLRYTGQTDATVWVETSGPCEVEVLGYRDGTFCVEDHHYAVVVVEGLEPGRAVAYEVHLDGERRWPEDGSPFPPSLIRVPGPGAALEVVFGSCRVSLPQEPPYTLTPEEDDRGRGPDALRALAQRMLSQPAEGWPHKLVMLGDQVYADEPPPAVMERIGARHDRDRRAGLSVVDFEEYTWLYHEAWGEPLVRWLLSTVPSAMVWDDHDMHDDWNISSAWVREMRQEHWWSDRVAGGIASYWVYQHVANLAPDELRRSELFAQVRAAQDAGPLLRDFAHRADHRAEGVRWSYSREFDGVRLVVMDSRAGRLLHGERHDAHEHRRAMLDDHEWAWVEEHVTGDVEHLLLATSLPVLLLRGLHDLEAWSEAVCDGAWGRLGARLGERIRRGADLEHWPAFQDSFHRLSLLLEEVAAGRRGRAPASITIISGDVHHAYLAEAAFPAAGGPLSPVHQAVCSPFRNDLPRADRWVLRFTGSRLGAAIGRLLARSAGGEDPTLRWRLVEGPYFDNQIATLRFDGPAAQLELHKTLPGDPHPDLERVFTRSLSAAGAPAGSRPLLPAVGGRQERDAPAPT